MADKSATQQLIELKAQRPQGRKSGAAWDDKNSDLLNILTRQAAVETGTAEQNLTQTGLQTTQAQGLQGYINSPEGQSQQNWNVGALTAPLVPAAVASTYLNRGIKSTSGKLGYGALEALAGAGLAEAARSQQPDALTNPAGHYSNQFWQNLMLSTGVGGALGSVRAALMQPKQSPAGPQGGPQGPTPPAGPTPPVVPPQPGPAGPLAGGSPFGPSSPNQAIAEAWGAKGLDAASAKSFVQSQIKSGNLTADQKSAFYNAIGETARPGQTLTNLARKLPVVGGLIAGAAGLGAYLYGGEAEAGGIPTEGPARDESLTQYRLRTLGLPSTPGEALNAASYAIPGIGEGRMAADVGTATGQVARALTQPGENTSVTGPTPDPRLAHFQNWVADQRAGGAGVPDNYHDALADVKNHMQMMQQKRQAQQQQQQQQQPMQQPGGGGPAGFPGAAAFMPPNVQIQPGTASMLSIMSQGRDMSNHAALLYRLGQAETQAQINNQSAG